MKLYAFYPRGHGPSSFFVAAEDEQGARDSVSKFVASDKGATLYGADCWPHQYEVEEFEPGAVAINGND